MSILFVAEKNRHTTTLFRCLNTKQFSANCTSCAIKALALARDPLCELIVLQDTFFVVRDRGFIDRLREFRQDIPVIVSMETNDVQSRIKFLDMGADDCVLRSIDNSEMIARIQAILRRKGPRRGPLLRFANVELDQSRGIARRGHKVLNLSTREFALLRMFMRHPNQILSRARLYDSVWGVEYDGLSNVLDVYVNYLRNKLEQNGWERVIQSVRGRGYILRENSNIE